MQDDLAGLVADTRNMARIAETQGQWRYFYSLEQAATTIESQAHEIAELRSQDDGWERVGFLEEKLRQAEANIETLNSHLPKYLAARTERDAANAKLRAAMEALEAVNADRRGADAAMYYSECQWIAGQAITQIKGTEHDG